MRLAMYKADGQPARPCVIEEDAVRPVSARSVQEILSEGRAGLDSAARDAEAAQPVPLATVRLVPPVSPAVVVAPGPRLQPDRSEELARHREFYLKSRHTIVGGDETIQHATALGVLSYRAQVGLVLAPTERHTPASQELRNLLGAVLAAELYSVDLLRVGWEGTMWHVRYGEGASFDGSCPVAPVFVSADEFELENLPLEDSTGRSEVQSDQVADFVGYVNRWMALGPDTLVLAGSGHGPVLSIQGADPVISFPEGEPRLGPGDRIVARSEPLGNIDLALGEGR